MANKTSRGRGSGKRSSCGLSGKKNDNKTTTISSSTSSSSSSSSSSTTSPIDISSFLTTIQDTLNELHTLTSPTYTFSFRRLSIEAQVSLEEDNNNSNSKSPRSHSKIPLSTFNAKLRSYIELFPKLRFQLGESRAKEFYLKILLGDIDITDEELYDSALQAREEEIKELKRQRRDLKAKMIELIEEIEVVSAAVAPLSIKTEENIEELKSLLIKLPELDRALKEEFGKLVDPNEDLNGVSGLSPQEMDLEMENLELEKLALEKDVNRINNDILIWGKKKVERLNRQLKPFEADYAALMDEAKQDEKLGGEEREIGMADKALHGRWNKAVLSAMKQMFEEVHR